MDVDDSVESDAQKLVFVTDKEKAARHGVGVTDIVKTLQLSLGGVAAGVVHVPEERSPLLIELRLPRAIRSSAPDLSTIHLSGRTRELVALAELGHWESSHVAKTIYHKILRQVVYVFGETAGRPPADTVVEITADRSMTGDPTNKDVTHVGHGWVSTSRPRPVEGRTFFTNGIGIEWHVPSGFGVAFAGEGEWKSRWTCTAASGWRSVLP